MEEIEAPHSSFSTKFMFIIFGVASLLAWNALLTELPFFDYFLHDMNPYVSFSFLNFILNIIFQFILLWKKDLFSLKFQLIVGIVGSIIFLILVPLCTMILEKNSFMNLFISGMLIVLMGFINALCSGGFFNFVSYFPLEMIVAFSTGQGFSGISMNVLEYILIFIIDTEGDQFEKGLTIKAWIFFGVSSLILVISLILLFVSLKSDYTKYYMNKIKDEDKRTESTAGLLTDESQQDIKISDIEIDKKGKKEEDENSEEDEEKEEEKNENEKDDEDEGENDEEKDGKKEEEDKEENKEEEEDEDKKEEKEEKEEKDEEKEKDEDGENEEKDEKEEEEKDEERKERGREKRKKKREEEKKRRERRRGN